MVWSLAVKFISLIEEILKNYKGTVQFLFSNVVYASSLWNHVFYSYIHPIYIRFEIISINKKTFLKFFISIYLINFVLEISFSKIKKRNLLGISSYKRLIAGFN